MHAGDIGIVGRLVAVAVPWLASWGGALWYVLGRRGAGRYRDVFTVLAAYLGAAGGTILGISLRDAFVVAFPTVYLHLGKSFTWLEPPPQAAFARFMLEVRKVVALYPVDLLGAVVAGILGALVPALSHLRGRLCFPAALVLPWLLNYRFNLQMPGAGPEWAVPLHLGLGAALWIGVGVGFAGVSCARVIMFRGRSGRASP